MALFRPLIWPSHDVPTAPETSRCILGLKDPLPAKNASRPWRDARGMARAMKDYCRGANRSSMLSQWS
jgi:hypothetical protein